MTLEEIELGLPNGFRQARLRRMAVDYEGGTATLELLLWVGEADSERIEEGARWRPARIVLTDLVYAAMEPPAEGRRESAAPPRVESASLALGARTLPATPPGCFAHALVAADWHAPIFLSARDARLQWL